MAEIIGTKGKYDTEQGFSTKRENTTGEIQIVDSHGNIVDSEVDGNKASNRVSKGFKANEKFNRFVQSPAVDKAKQAASTVGQFAGALAQIGLKGAKSQVSNPMAQHNAQQAHLAENQAAQLRAQQQQANQIANRTSTTTGAINEAQKVSEQAALQKQRLAAQQMVGDAGLANVAAAKAGAEVDPSQRFSEMQALGSQERQRSIELGKDTAAMQSTAEAQRAKSTAELEEKQQVAQRNAQAEAASEAYAARQAHQDELNEDLTKSQIAKNKAEGQKLSSEGKKTMLENTAAETAAAAQTDEQKVAVANKIIARLKPGTALSEEEKLALYNGYIAASKKMDGSGTAMLNNIAAKNGKDTAFRDWFLQTYETNNGKNNIYNDISDKLSDKRMKTIETPIGHALMGIWRGRTI